MNRAPTPEEVDNAMELVKSFIVAETEPDFLPFAAIFLRRFFVTAHEEQWPIFQEEFPVVLRAIAIMLDEFHKN